LISARAAIDGARPAHASANAAIAFKRDIDVILGRSAAAPPR
jgi:hypothetical protein